MTTGPRHHSDPLGDAFDRTLVAPTLRVWAWLSAGDGPMLRIVHVLAGIGLARGVLHGLTSLRWIVP